jgi:cellulose synthase/poly-beta-1,6-N-acetylglucosamine synthase-like glycosyltransferase
MFFSLCCLKQNILTLCFNFEYVSWFYFLFRGYSIFKINAPLGGTSNHIKKEVLIRCGYWDSYNVTEDLELSVVLTKLAFKIRFINSFTEEQCVYNLKCWFFQRRRWMKGYYITYLQNFFKFNVFDLKNMFYFHGIVGFSAFGFLVLPCLYFYFFINKNQIYCLSYLFYFSNILTILFVVSCVILPISFVFVCLNKKNAINLLLIAISYPLYFILHFFCSIWSFIEIFKCPYKWNKTIHDKPKEVYS